MAASGAAVLGDATHIIWPVRRDAGRRAASEAVAHSAKEAGEMSVKEMAVQQSVEVPTDSETAFKLWTAGINEWWKRGSHYWNDGKRALGLRLEPGVGGRFIEVYDAATGEGLEIGRIRVWEPGKRLVYSWREADWAAEEITEVEVLFESVALA